MILASQSPRRQAILTEVGISPVVMPVDIDETPLPGESPLELVERLAKAKAETCAALAQSKDVPFVTFPTVILAADTLVWDESGDVLGKPKDEAEAKEMLRMLSGSTHYASSGVCLIQLDEQAFPTKQASFTETTGVEFYPLSEIQIDAYVATGEPLDKAGAYGIQGKGRALVKGITGDFFNVAGLPVARILRELESFEDAS